MTIQTIAMTDVGRTREHNEDSVYAEVISDSTVLAVADGMGGHRAGDIASETALETFVDSLEQSDWEESTIDALVAGAEQANTHLHKLAADNPDLEGMGTTLVAAVIEDGVAKVVNIGDSRAYHVTVDGIEQVTTDQSLVQELVRQGTIDPEEADDHPQKNVLSQALGTDETVEPDTYEFDIEGTVVLCSDGLSDEVADDTIQELVTTADTLDMAARDLINHANNVDGSDNVSAVLGR